MRTFFVFLFLLFVFVHPAYASYVLPYPGVMPGNKLYKVSELFDSVKNIYSIGDFAQFKYNLSQSDKYLVEAKTLFEYVQYPLAAKALQKSNDYFKRIPNNLSLARKHGKNTQEKEAIYKDAQVKHIEVLSKIRSTLPESFVWQDEKKSPVVIEIGKLIDESLRVRSSL